MGKRGTNTERHEMTKQVKETSKVSWEKRILEDVLTCLKRGESYNFTSIYIDFSVQDQPSYIKFLKQLKEMTAKINYIEIKDVVVKFNGVEKEFTLQEFKERLGF